MTLEPEVPVVTFISRNLEPMRGFPTFMHALPELQKLHPSVQVVIVGGDEVSYSNAPDDGRSWRQVLLGQSWAIALTDGDSTCLAAST